jgi:hypothetical protein
MAFNLIRNSRVFFTTNVNALGIVASSGFTSSNTFELQVQDGFSFSQNTTSETITINEAGDAPVRGQRSFNTALEPVTWSFATYIRPYYAENTVTGGIDGDDAITAEESCLWGAISSVNGNGWATVAGSAPSTMPYSTVAFTNSNAHQLQTFGLLIVFDDVTYAIDNAAVESATIDFGIDAIASISWEGRGTNMRSLATTTLTTSGASVTFGGALSGSAQARNTDAKYITNKLSTLVITRPANTALGQTSKSYTVALTGGSLTIANNLTYLTPANLGVVNQPCAYFTGTRAISSTVNAYLRTGTNESSTLLNDVLTQSLTEDENMFAVTVKMGGATSVNRVEFEMPAVMLSIPTITSEQVISTTINMMPQGSTGSDPTKAYSLEATNELAIKYYGGPAT